MKNNNLYKPKVIDSYANTTTEVWIRESKSIHIIVKPENANLSIKGKLIHCWYVLTGKAIAVTFYKQ